MVRCREGSARRFVFLVILLLAFALFTVASQPAAACSLAPVSFEEAAWVDPQRFVATFEGNVVLFDFSDGLAMTPVSGGFFHRVASDPAGDQIAIRVQEGLGAMCEGEVYLDIWDAQQRERVERLSGSYGLLASSEAGLVAGSPGLVEVVVYPWGGWEEGRQVQTGLPEASFDRIHRVAVAFSQDGRHLLAAAEEDPRLFRVPLGPEDPSGLSWLEVSGGGFDATPRLVSEPAGDRVALWFSQNGRDRVLLVDAQDLEQGFVGVMNATGTPDASRHSVAWTQNGWAVVGGDRIRHVGSDGRFHEFVLAEHQSAREVIGSQMGPTWVVLVEDWENGHQVIRYIDAGVVMEQWVHREAGWEMMHPEDWAHLDPLEQGDPSWGPSAPVGGGSGPQGPYVPGPALAVMLVMLVLVLRVFRR